MGPFPPRPGMGRGGMPMPPRPFGMGMRGGRPPGPGFPAGPPRPGWRPPPPPGHPGFRHPLRPPFPPGGPRQVGPPNLRYTPFPSAGAMAPPRLLRPRLPPPMAMRPPMLPPAAKKPVKRPPVRRKPKVPAGLKLPSSTDEFEKWIYAKVVAIGTGTKCIGGEYISGERIHGDRAYARSGVRGEHKDRIPTMRPHGRINLEFTHLQIPAWFSTILTRKSSPDAAS